MSNDQLQKVLEKIRRCLALSKSANEHEAALALEKARELMEKYNIEEGDLENQTIDDIIEIDFMIGLESNEPEKVLAVWLGKAFFVTPIIMNVTKTPRSKKVTARAIRFIGHKADVAATTYIFSYMMNLIHIKAQDYFESKKKAKKWTDEKAPEVKDAFALGFAYAVVEKLKAIEAQNAATVAAEAEANLNHAQIETKALAVIKNDLVKKYMEENHPNAQESEKGKVKCDENHYNAGYIEGEKHGIHKGVDINPRRKEIKK